VRSSRAAARAGALAAERAGAASSVVKNIRFARLTDAGQDRWDNNLEITVLSATNLRAAPASGDKATEALGDRARGKAKADERILGDAGVRRPYAVLFWNEMEIGRTKPDVGLKPQWGAFGDEAKFELPVPWDPAVCQLRVELYDREVHQRYSRRNGPRGEFLGQVFVQGEMFLNMDVEHKEFFQLRDCPGDGAGGCAGGAELPPPLPTELSDLIDERQKTTTEVALEDAEQLVKRKRVHVVGATKALERARKVQQKAMVELTHPLVRANLLKLVGEAEARLARALADRDAAVLKLEELVAFQGETDQLRGNLGLPTADQLGGHMPGQLVLRMQYKKHYRLRPEFVPEKERHRRRAEFAKGRPNCVTDETLARATEIVRLFVGTPEGKARLAIDKMRVQVLPARAEHACWPSSGVGLVGWCRWVGRWVGRGK
jgi:hypothetical protein